MGTILAIISTHAPAGGATCQASAASWPAVFLLTPLREGRLALGVRNGQSGRDFYSRPCGRGDEPLLYICSSSSHFYSRPCGRGDQGHDAGGAPSRDHFYSRPCGRGDEWPEWLSQIRPGNFYSRPCGRGDKGCADRHTGCHTISTHAPAGGATYPVWFHRPSPRISTHAPAGGATNSRPNLKRRYLYISTHAPAGGATGMARSSASLYATFLLTPLREGRPMQRLTGCLISHFYSRPCGRGDAPLARKRPQAQNFYSRPCGRGDWNTRTKSWSSTANFYSRPCGRGDSSRSPQKHRPKNFYSRPCGRGDFSVKLPRVILFISTHAPAGGATQSRAKKKTPHIFLLTPLREGRLAVTVAPADTVTFLLTPLREGRPGQRGGSRPVREISTHAPAGGAT